MTLPDTKNRESPVGNKNWKRIPRTNAMPQTPKGLILQKHNDTLKKQMLKSRVIQAQRGPQRDEPTLYRQHYTQHAIHQSYPSVRDP